ncbi:MAG TPA: prolyl oligopeptidase family serine peptidase [Ideonella sp.]|uniref:S9 family peptidase n=1 Tax=Ideonella sp. TaxID=1929293 RepID=UPI002C2141AE|nr:prolyl oligopeptidase family serine peptidase [Ideonella sp.]HSI47769.1 prolyl oligopeptidase family serine peptidase [Ideonella sp.]
MSVSLARLLAATLSVAVLPATLAAPSSPATPSGYSQPPKNILDVLHAPSPPVPFVSPTRQAMLLVSWTDYPAMSRVATPFLKLAGARVEIANHSKHDTPGGYGIAPCAQSLQLVRLPDGASTPLALPAGACPGEPVWAADGQRFAFANTTRDAVELWVGNAATGALRRMPGVRLNPMLDNGLQWLPDQKTLLVLTVPAGLGAPPPEPIVPSGPSIQQTTGAQGESSTYENRDTLNSPHDEDLFDHYASSQVTLVNTASGSVVPVGKPANHESLDAAPDGRHVLVTRIHKPYSYVTTHERFPREVEVWDIGNPAKVSVAKIASIPLTDRVPVAGVPVGPREFSWRQTEPATLVWAEALDGGDWKVDAPQRDKVMLLKAPFTAAPTEVVRLAQRYVGVLWGERAGTAVIDEFDENRHWRRGLMVDFDQAAPAAKVVWDLSSDEKYANPGRPVFRRLASGALVMRQDGDAIFLSGLGASPDGDRPFLDRLDLNTLQSQRLFRSDKTAFERFLAFTGPDNQHFLTWHQTPASPPNALLRTLGAPVDAATGEAKFATSAAAVTHLPDPTPEVRAIQKRLVKYKRADGLDLSFTLYTPPGYVEGTRVPTILYAYPLDYADPAKAGQVTGSQATFTRLRQYRLLLLAGYAIIDNAAFPIVGDPKRAYDSYMDQLVADAKAAVDEAVRLGVADPERVGVTGHSHGALMTVNLLAHSDLFRAGVATSGSYNKTLTPFGFQSERRSVWDAPEVYTKVSPFFYADKLKTPVLIVHGADDANPGTTPLQASKLYEALRGNGGTARLVMLPHEPHWYAAMESNEQLIAEMVSWFDQYVKNAAPRKVAAK